MPQCFLEEKKVLENLPSTHTFNFISSDAWQEIFATLAKYTAKKIKFYVFFSKETSLLPGSAYFELLMQKSNILEEHT